MNYRLKHYLHRRLHCERFGLLDQLLHNQTLSKAQLITRQQQALSSIIQHAYSNTPYYHEKYVQSSRNDAQELVADSLPILQKDEVVQHRDEMLARDIDKRTLSMGNTGGSTGKPLSFYYDQHKHELMRAGMCRSYMWSGWKPGQKILNFWGARQDIRLGNSFSKKFQDYVSAEKTITAHEYSEEQLHDWAKTIRSYQPVLLQGYASILAELSRYIIANNIQMPPTILGIYSTAEVLYDWQRTIMEQAFGCKVFNQYGSREIPNIACECRHGNQHIFTDMVHLESQSINQEDRLIITSLSNRVMPFIRYDIGDAGKLKDGDCACSSPFPMMEMGLCRSNDLIKSRSGKTIHPSYFNRLLYGQTDISQYQYIQSELDKMTLNIVSPSRLGVDTINSLKQSLRRDIDENMTLEINYVEEIKRSISGKHRFVIGNLKAGN
jgi:phenylacetate-CoA ligase